MKTTDKGIWIDEREAWIVYKDDEIKLKKIGSEVEPFRVHGGSGSSTPYGPQDTVSETKFMRRKKQQLKQYFVHLIDELKPVDRLYIAGPAEAKIGLESEIAGMSHDKINVVAVDTTDIMTENQWKAMVREFFGNLS